MCKHAMGISFREWNAGPRIDENMTDEGKRGENIRSWMFFEQQRIVSKYKILAEGFFEDAVAIRSPFWHFFLLAFYYSLMPFLWPHTLHTQAFMSRHTWMQPRVLSLAVCFLVSP